jgi:hypothetical protein
MTDTPIGADPDSEVPPIEPVGRGARWSHGTERTRISAARIWVIAAAVVLAPLPFFAGLDVQNPAGVEQTPCSANPTEEQTTLNFFRGAGGTFTLTWNGHTTGTIAYNATAATILSVLEGGPVNFPAAGASATVGPAGTASVVITYLSTTLPITGNVSGITGGTNTISSLTLPARSCRGT